MTAIPNLASFTFFIAESIDRKLLLFFTLFFRLQELYEERVQLMEAERAKLTEKIADDAKAMEQVKNELSDLALKYEMASEEVDAEKQRNLALTVDMSGWAAQARSCQRELTAMNGLLTQMLLSPSPEDLDHLAEQLQQNHALIAQITTCEDCSDVAAALPKLLLDLMAQVNSSSAYKPNYGTPISLEYRSHKSETLDKIP